MIRHTRSLHRQPRIPETFVPILARLQAESDRLFGMPRVVFEPVAVFERPFSQLLEMRIAGDGDVPHVFIKRFKAREPRQSWGPLLRERLEREYQTSLCVHGALSPKGLLAVRPIACFPDDLVLVTEQLPGRALSAILEEQAGWQCSRAALARLSQIFERVGAWIRAFQQTAAIERRLRLDDVRQYLDQRLHLVVQSDRHKFCPRNREELLRYFDRCASEIAEEDLHEVVAHNDFCPANVLVDGIDVGVIDFDRVGTGAIYLDLARMFTQLEFLRAKPKFRPWVVEQLQSALLRGFDPGLRPDRALFQLMVLQHTVCQFTKLTVRPPSFGHAIWDRYVRRRHRLSLIALAEARPADNLGTSC